MRRLGFALLLVARAALAADDPAPTLSGEVRLATREDASALCDAVSGDAAAAGDALAGVYVVTIPSDGFALAPYDGGRARLSVDDARGFRSRAGAFELVEHDLAGQASAPATGLDMAVPAAASDAAAIARAHRAGTLLLTVWFQLPGGGRQVCAAVHQVDKDGLRIAVEPIAFELTLASLGPGGQPERVASGESPVFAALRAETGPVVVPRVVVQPPLNTGARGRVSAAVTRAASGLETDLLACYRDGLRSLPSLRGSIALGVEIAADGRVAAARQEVDSLGAPAVTACVLDRVRAARFPAGSARLSIPIQFTSAD